MKISSVEKRIKKISRVVSDYKEDNQISSLEKDLLLGYIRELYDLVLHSEATEAASTKATNKKSKASHVEASKKEVEIEEVVPEPAKMDDTVHAQPIVQKINAKLAELEQRMVVEEVLDSSVSHQSMQAPARTAVATEAASAPESQTEVEEDTSTTTHSNAVPEEMIELFEDQGGNDLGDRLSRSKIQNLSSVIGINEKIFTVQELFGGNGDLYKTVVDKLEKSSSFEEGKKVLIEDVAMAQEWHSPEKKNKATNFIKIVRRLYA